MVGKTKKKVKGKWRWEQAENILLKTKSFMFIVILHLTSKCDKFHEHIIVELR
jgi:hypothetical protein